MESPGAGPQDEERRVRLVEVDGHLYLTVDGLTMSAVVRHGRASPGYWEAMLPGLAPSKALVLGLAGGTIAHLLRHRYPDAQIVGVDTDQEVLEFARLHLGLEWPGLEVVAVDAFQYVAACRQHFDYIAVDLFDNQGFVRPVLSRRFLRQLKRIAAPGGEIVFNLFKERRTGKYVHRIGLILPVSRIAPTGYNLVVHCRLGLPGLVTGQ